MAQTRQLSRAPEIQGTSGTLRGRLARALGIFQQKNIRVPLVPCISGAHKHVNEHFMTNSLHIIKRVVYFLDLINPNHPLPWHIRKQQDQQRTVAIQIQNTLELRPTMAKGSLQVRSFSDSVAPLASQERMSAQVRTILSLLSKMASFSSVPSARQATTTTSYARASSTSSPNNKKEALSLFFVYINFLYFKNTSSVDLKPPV